ncbi:MAG: ABC transporter ATP-binding protein [Bacteroidetes bacterium]|nr:ABC transporter ATP-binding protein [Bacteroidota bacterium]
MKELSYLNKYFFKYKYYFLSGILFIIISNVFQIIPAQLVRRALDLVVENIALYKGFQGLEIQKTFYGIFAGSIFFYAILILIMALLRGGFLFLVRQTLIVMSRHIEYDLKNEIYNQYQILPLSFYRKNSTGDLMNRISEDVSRVRMYLGPSIMYGLNLFILFLILIPYMISINPKLTLYTLVPLPILSICIYYVNNIINKRSEEIQKSLSGLSTFVQEAFSGIRVIKSFVRENDMITKFEMSSNEYKDKSLKLTSVDALFFPIIMALIGLSTVLVVYIGGGQVINGTASFGNIAEFIIYVNLLTWPVASLGWITSIIQRAAASQKRINEFLKIKPGITSGKAIKKEIKGGVTFKSVSFVYPDTGIKALTDVSFSLKPGESLAIIGTTGSGKSTIANLICRMYDPTSGTILIDDTDLKNLDLSAYRSQLGYVPQDVFLFSESIYNNISFGSVNLESEDIIQAARDADLYDNVQQFPDGFNTRIGERGITLSGGQKQRVSIARAITRKPRILILDDALSAVDTKTENTILESMEKIMKDRTTIIISHRISSAKLANRIIVLHDGRIIQKGTNESLLAREGTYKDLYEKQLLAEEIV